MATLLTILATISIPMYFDSKEKADSISSTMKAREAANEIAQALDSTYNGGSVGSSALAEYWLPRNVEEIGAVSIGNQLCVEISLKDGEEIIEVRSSTLLPTSWTDNVELDNISIEKDNRTYHRTTMTLELTDGNGEPEYGITVSDNITRRE